MKVTRINFRKKNFYHSVFRLNNFESFCFAMFIIMRSILFIPIPLFTFFLILSFPLYIKIFSFILLSILTATIIVFFYLKIKERIKIKNIIRKCLEMDKTALTSDENFYT
jgi:membrane protein implicated in regulation of membrane protease activity